MSRSRHSRGRGNCPLPAVGGLAPTRLRLTTPRARARLAPLIAALGDANELTVRAALAALLPERALPQLETQLLAGAVRSGKNQPLDGSESVYWVDAAAGGVWIYRPVADADAKVDTIAIVAENERWLIADKPPGIATMPRGKYVARSLTLALRRQLGEERIICAHRLDRLTAGLVLAVREPQLRGTYQGLFAQPGRVNKTYLAIAPAGLVAAAQEFAAGSDGRVTLPGASNDATVQLRFPGAQTVEIDAPLAKVAGGVTVRVDECGKAARTLIRDLGKISIPNTESTRSTCLLGDVRTGNPPHNNSEWAVYAVAPRTGRMHQIRAHFAALGFPLLGDPLYGGNYALPYGMEWDEEDAPETALPLQLVAATLSFHDPISNEDVTARSAFAEPYREELQLWERDELPSSDQQTAKAARQRGLLISWKGRIPTVVCS